jgi:hypothetical protein
MTLRESRVGGAASCAAKAGSIVVGGAAGDDAGDPEMAPTAGTMPASRSAAISDPRTFFTG